MPEYLAPGVYMEEIEIGPKPIEGVSTSTVGFLGETERGPTKPKFVTSWTQYQRIYGSYFGEDKYLPYAVQGFFANGGKRCFIARIVSSSDKIAKHELKEMIGDNANPLRIFDIKAIGKGDWGNNLLYQISDATSKNDKHFKLSVYYPISISTSEIDDYNTYLKDLASGKANLQEIENPIEEENPIEIFDELSVEENSPYFYEKKVNNISNLITIDNQTPNKRPSNSIHRLNIPVRSLDEDVNYVIFKLIKDKFDWKNQNLGYEISDVNSTTKMCKLSIYHPLPESDSDIENYKKIFNTEFIYEDLSLTDSSLQKVEESKYISLTLKTPTKTLTKIKNKGIFILKLGNNDLIESDEDIDEVFNITKKEDWNNGYLGLKISDASSDSSKFNLSLYPISDSDYNKYKEILNPRTQLENLSVDAKAFEMVNELNNKGIFLLKNSMIVDYLKDKIPNQLSLNDFLGNGSEKPNTTGLKAFSEINDISIIYSPYTSKINDLSDRLLGHCENLKDRFVIIDSDEGVSDVSEVEKPVTSDKGYAAFYYPWIKVVDPQDGTLVSIPPGGHVAGVYARSDVERGVFKAPANEVLRGVSETEFNISKGEQDLLNPKGINAIRAFPGRGIRVWGARTVSTDPLWKYINIRRLFIYLEESIEQATQWVVFEPNSERLWDRVIQTITQFLTSVWKDGALMGNSPGEAFFVRCDRTTMTQSDIDNGRLIVMIGVAPVKPAEFVIFRIAQWTSSG